MRRLSNTILITKKAIKLMDQKTNDRPKETIEATAESHPQWTSIDWEDFRGLKVAFNKVNEVLLKLLNKSQINLAEISKKMAGSILKPGCDGSSLPFDLKQEAKEEHAIVIKLRNNKIKVFDFEKECTLSIPIDNTFHRKFSEFSKMIIRQIAA